MKFIAWADLKEFGKKRSFTEFVVMLRRWSAKKKEKRMLLSEVLKWLCRI